MKITVIPPEHVPSVWKQASEYLEKATKTIRLRADIVDLYEGCLTGAYNLWIVYDDEADDEMVTAFTSQIIQYPRDNALSIQYLGGKKMREWFDLVLEVLERFAKDCECETIEGYGREAWVRFTKSKGFHKAYAAFEKEVV